MRVKQLIEKICTQQDDSQSYVIVAFTGNHHKTEYVHAMWFDVLGPFDDAIRAEQQTVKILEEFHAPAYNVQIIKGKLCNDIIITKTVAEFESDLLTRGYKRI